MKFQNSSIHGFKVMLCIKKRDEWTEGRMDIRTTQKQYAPPTSLKLGTTNPFTKLQGSSSNSF